MIHDPRLLQEVGVHCCPHDLLVAGKTDLNELAETAAVVVANCFGISDGLGKEK